MKWFYHLFWMRIKITGKQPLLWFLLVISILFSLIPINAFLRAGENRIPIAIINLDQGKQSEQFIEAIKTLPEIVFIDADSIETAKKRLAVGEYEGVIIIQDTFTEQIENARFSDILQILVSPSSSVTSFLAEVFSEKVIEIWADEFIIQEYQSLRESFGEPATEQEIAVLREEIFSASTDEVLINLTIHQPDFKGEQPSASEVMSIEDAVSRSVLYYCAMIIIFLFTSSRWVLDQRQSSVGLRMESLGVAPGLAILSSSFAMAFFCAGVLFFALASFYFAFDLSIGFLALQMVSAMLYFMGVIGLVLIFTVFTNESVSLMLVTPLAILINSLLGGMFYPLPDWAILWKQISILLPGRLLNMALLSDQLWPLAVGGGAYLLIGVVLSSLKQTASTSRRMLKS